MEHKSHGFEYKIEPMGVEGLIYRAFGLICGNLKKLRVFDVAPGVEKSIKTDPWGTKGRKGTKDSSHGGGLVSVVVFFFF